MRPMISSLLFEQAHAMLQAPHAGFHVHDAVWVPEDDRAFARQGSCQYVCKWRQAARRPQVERMTRTPSRAR
jgi:hypothetical protein